MNAPSNNIPTTTSANNNQSVDPHDNLDLDIDQSDTAALSSIHDKRPLPSNESHPNYEKYYKHTKKSKGRIIFTCAFNGCKQIFKRKSHIEQHLNSKSHLNIRLFKCPECMQSFARRNCLTKHTPVHTANKPFVCDKCEQGFTQKGSCDRHITKFHS